MSRLTDKEWIQLTRIMVEQVHLGLRMGQGYMNALHSINDKLYYEISNTEADCFYDDNKIINFINFLDEQV